MGWRKVRGEGLEGGGSGGLVGGDGLEKDERGWRKMGGAGERWEGLEGDFRGSNGDGRG